MEASGKKKEINSKIKLIVEEFFTATLLFTIVLGLFGGYWGKYIVDKIWFKYETVGSIDNEIKKVLKEEERIAKKFPEARVTINEIENIFSDTASIQKKIVKYKQTQGGVIKKYYDIHDYNKPSKILENYNNEKLKIHEVKKFNVKQSRSLTNANEITISYDVYTKFMYDKVEKINVAHDTEFIILKREVPAGGGSEKWKIIFMYIEADDDIRAEKI